MKVLHVYRTYFPDTQGGLEEVIRQICINAQSLEMEHSVECRVFYLSKNPMPDKFSQDGILTIRAPLHFEIASCSISLQCMALFKEQVEWADIINYHFPWPFADMLHLLGRVKKPYVVTYHSDIVKQKGLLQLYKPLMKWFLGKADAVVATSPNYAKSSDVLSACQDKLEIIPLGISEDSYPSLENDILISLEEKLGRDFFLFVGVLRYYKGLHLLLDALRQLPEIKVVIAGKGPEERELKKKVEDLGLNNVIFVGYVSDAEKVALYTLSRGVIFPSHIRSEAFGVTLLEASMFSKPMISCEIETGTSFVNLNGVTGTVVDPSVPSELVKAIRDFHYDPEKVCLLGENARNRYLNHFTGKSMARSYLELYGKLLNYSSVNR
ncbi:hypothetical protein WH50_07790 [Pokkaliibacter plantistimulans]|uniref:Glycosyl transferase family 1 n=1 Tax=Pokkaliibacter plantistimulans TaxID=1635171 RepID=A0ABX5M258_9GAMM|nr:glycosyltransferase [Pokkaliibacter plantistimulans]PXF31823.1 hypothetical protein WH50_07790 [Pokkaliibacter plantistimulans]